jgi:demethylmenaquinone methyltransferase / 2-methoxy-6-polyprenyl-1,4-benzoquinol methylase
LTRQTLRQALGTPEGKSRYVRGLFARIADRYDVITKVLSYGQDRRWKRRLATLAPLSPDSRVLDLATGTGDIAREMAARGPRVVGLDITLRMIELARAKDRRNAYLVGDMLALPFRSASFDVVTTGYGLRNVPDLDRALDEILRVLKGGGHVLALDFDRPANRFVRMAYLTYLNVVGGLLGWILHRDPDTYRYIPASIRNYPGAKAVARLMESRGFARARHYPLLGGLMAIHHARK